MPGSSFSNLAEIRSHPLQNRCGDEPWAFSKPPAFEQRADLQAPTVFVDDVQRASHSISADNLS